MWPNMKFVDSQESARIIVQNIRKSVTNALSEKKFSMKILRVYTNIKLRIMNSLYKLFKGLKMGSNSDEVLFSNFQDSAEAISSQT